MHEHKSFLRTREEPLPPTITNFKSTKEISPKKPNIKNKLALGLIKLSIHTGSSGLASEWIQVQVLRRPGSRMALQKNQHPLPPNLLQNRHPPADHPPPPITAPIQYTHTKKIHVVSVWRICRWMPIRLHVWHAVEKPFMCIAKTIFLEVV